MKKTIYNSIFICIISTVLGITYNSFSNQGIPLFGPQKFSEISIEELKIRLNANVRGIIICVDARSREDFASNHIKGAINLPFNDFEIAYQEAANNLIPVEKEIIVYCEGKDSPKGLTVAENLRQLGHTNIKILSEGWKGWIRTE